MKKQDYSLITSLSGFAITLVVLTHSRGAMPEKCIDIATTDRLYAFFLLVREWIVTFHIPLFFVISGYLFVYTFNANFKKTYFQYISQKARRLLIPYVVVSSIAFPLKAILSLYAIRPVDFSFFSYIEVITCPGKNPIIFFWFLPTLFTIYLFYRMLQVSLRNEMYIFLMMVFFVFLYFWVPSYSSYIPYVLRAVSQFIIFFYVGILIRTYNVDIYFVRYGIFAFIVSVALFLFFRDKNIYISKLVLPVLGIVFSWSFADFFLNYTNSLSLLIGRYSYQVYLFSWFPQIFFKILLGQLFFVNIWLAVVSMFLGGLMLPIVMTMLLNKIVPNNYRFLYGSK